MAEHAQPVQYRLVEAGHARERRVGMQRFDVAGEAIHESLLRVGRHLDDLVRGAVRGLVAGRRPLLAAEAALASDERPEYVVVDNLTGLVEGLDLDLDEGALALVVDVGDLGLAGQLAAGGRGSWVLLTAPGGTVSEGLDYQPQLLQVAARYPLEQHIGRRRVCRQRDVVYVADPEER